MFTKKSVIVGIGLILALICVGTVSTFASSVKPSAVKSKVKPFSKAGIAAIHPLDGGEMVLPAPAVSDYLENNGSILGPTLSGFAPQVDDLELTTVGTLFSAHHLLVPGVPDSEQVYYAHMMGPFNVSQSAMPSVGGLGGDLLGGGLPIVGGLLPGLGGMANGGLPVVGGLLGKSAAPAPYNSGSSGSQYNGSGSNSSNGGLLGGGVSKLLPSAYEVFDAHSGNLLGYGA
jgi:hypothetical protein